MPKSTEKRFCEKCAKTLSVSEFYQSNNLEKYPDRYLNQCKKCLTMHVDNWNPDTYLWILQECDVPYIPDEWNKLMASYARDNKKISGLTIIGRYLSKMKLNQWNKYRWKDTEFLQELAKSKIEQAMKNQGYDIQQITEVLEKNTFSMPEGELAPPPPPVPDEKDINMYMPVQAPNYPGNDFYPVQDNAEDSLVDSLTEEDKLMLRIKWGKTYKPDEWIWLEKLYNEMMGSYDIQSAGHIDTLKMICKTSLKANQLLDIGDVDGAQKMVKMYDMLMKSGRFTAAQNKNESGNDVDSISELVALCEKDGFIPRYYTDGPQDKVDRTLQDLQNYTRQLVTEEMNLGNLIENAVKQIQADKEKEALTDADAASDDDVFEAELFDEDKRAILNDEDFEELQDFIEENEIDDEEYLKSLVDNDEELI